MKQLWFLNLVCDTVGLLGGIFELLDDGVELVGLVLEGLHLLPDGVHGDGCWSELVSADNKVQCCYSCLVPRASNEPSRRLREVLQSQRRPLLGLSSG